MKIGREFDAAFGSLAREELEKLGSPGRGHSLIKQRFSGEYVVFSEPNWVLYLGKEFTQVRVVKQITEGNTDYAILACIRADGSLKNTLLVMPAATSRTSTYNLNSDSDKPFSVDVTQKPTRLIQEMDSPASQRVWYLDNGLRGPAIVSTAKSELTGSRQRTKRTGEKISTTPTAPTLSAPPMPLPPPVDPSATVRMEEPDGTQPKVPVPGKPTPAQAKPVIILDPQPAVRSPEQQRLAPSAESAPPKPVAPAPVIILK